MGKKRDVPTTFSALDRLQIVKSFADANIPISDFIVDDFFRRLHNSNYAPLPTLFEDKECKDMVPKRFKKHMVDKFSTLTSKVVFSQTSTNGTTTKLLVELFDGHRVESVIMRHEKLGGDQVGRTTLCVSSQVGCQMGCTFCATGTMGIIGDLSAGEILEQLVHANAVLETPVRNVVFMGMGEPLNNYANVKEAVKGMVDTKRFGLGHGHVTVSTVGITPIIRKLSAEMPYVNLALSLHAPNQELRTQIVPAAKAYKIEGLIDALDNHMKGGSGEEQDDREVKGKKKKKARKAMIQYTMLNGPTATFECAHQLGKLCEGRNIIVNLIPYNQTDVKDKYSCPPLEHIEEFQRIVMSYGLFVFIRKTMGEDIAGACGQLVLQKDIKEGGAVGDIEETLNARSGSSSGGRGGKKQLSGADGASNGNQADPRRDDDNNNNNNNAEGYEGMQYSRAFIGAGAALGLVALGLCVLIGRRRAFQRV